MVENKLIPTIRFSEFSKEWKTYKMKDLFTINAGGDIDKNHVSKTKTEKYKYPIYANAEKDKGLYGYSDIYKIEGETLTIAGRGVNIGIAHARDEKFYPIVRLLVLKPKNKEDNKFLEYQFNRQNILIESTGVPQLTAPQVSTYKICKPILEEQQKIASFLSSVDEKKELLQQKKDLLEQYKKGVMQQIFSQQIRFKDEDGNDYPDWKKRKLSEICELHHGYQFRRGDFVKDGLAIIKIGNVIGHELNLEDVSFIESNRYDEFKKFEILSGDILMSLTGNIGRVIEVKNVPFTLIQNYRVGKFVPFQSNELKKTFLKYLLESNMVFGRFNQLSNQSAQANFGKQDMDKINILLPSVNEQIKIADFLSALNQKIQILNNQLKKTQKFKKGLLQRMFV